MRTSFIKTLIEIARDDPRVILVTPDMGFSVLEKFRDEFPERIINSGIAEQNSVGVAAGLALSGKIAYVYSIVPFVTMRPFEQVRIDACYQNLPVKLVGTGGGLTYGALGPTHHSIEDISLMRSLPNMSVLCPGDPVEAGLCTKFSHQIPGPVYLRLGKGNDPTIHKSIPEAAFGNGIQLKFGDRATIITTGNLLGNGMAASEMLEKDGKPCSLISMPSVKPIDKELILSLAGKGSPIFTLEEHSIIGGLGGAVSEILAESGLSVPFTRIGMPDRFCKEVGSQEYLRKLNHLDAESIAKTISSKL